MGAPGTSVVNGDSFQAPSGATPDVSGLPVGSDGSLSPSQVAFPQFAFDGDGNAWWLGGEQLPAGWVPAWLASNFVLRPIS